MRSERLEPAANVFTLAHTLPPKRLVKVPMAHNTRTCVSVKPGSATADAGIMQRVDMAVVVAVVVVSGRLLLATAMAPC